ncbi:hypothetical protein SFUMM280S_09210 [Streptomyces fumanus]
MASKFFFTAAASTGVPSLKVAPGRRWKVKDRASSPTSQLRASQGTMRPVAGSWSVSESTVWRSAYRVSLLPTCCGSRHPASVATAKDSVPPDTGGPLPASAPPEAAPPQALDVVTRASIRARDEAERPGLGRSFVTGGVSCGRVT